MFGCVYPLNAKIETYLAKKLLMIIVMIISANSRKNIQPFQKPTQKAKKTEYKQSIAKTNMMH